MDINVSITKDTIDYFINVIMPQVVLSMLGAACIIVLGIYVYHKYGQKRGWW